MGASTMTARHTSVDSSLESIVRLLHVEAKVVCLLLSQLLARLHLVQRDKPLYDLASMLKVLVGDFVDGLDHV